MKDDTRKLVDEAAARAGKATPGPWGVTECDQRFSIDRVRPFEGVGETLEKNDADFFAHARDDIPALCAAVRALDAENERLCADAVAAYKSRLVVALRGSGAIVRRLLADEIEADKWDSTPEHA